MTITKDDALNALQKARKVQHLMKDERSIRALDVAERYIRGEASREELEKAKDEARNAYDAVDADWTAHAAARDAARAAARAAYAAAYAAVAAANLERKNKMTITKDDALNALQKARKVQHLMKDERSIRALDVAERYIRGEASREELELAKDEARNAYDAVDADWTAHAAAWDARAAYDAVDVAYAAAVDVVWTAYYAARAAYADI